jgi:uncharacterized protein
MRNNKIQKLGIGIGLRSAQYEEIVAGSLPIDWLEIISDHYLNGGSPLRKLERILEKYRVVMHGVGLDIGSPDPIDWDYLKRLKALQKFTKSPWISDHLSWGKMEGAHFHDLLPIPFTHSMISHVAERARIIQDYLEVPFALENISSYAVVLTNEMEEWEFYREVAERADIFMLLDLNNVYVSSRNHRYDPRDYLFDMPLDRVIQIHLGGHKDCGDYCVDTHDRQVADAVWELYGDVWPQTGGVSTLLEWDENLPSLTETWKEAEKARAYQHQLSIIR